MNVGSLPVGIRKPDNGTSTSDDWWQGESVVTTAILEYQWKTGEYHYLAQMFEGL